MKMAKHKHVATVEVCECGAVRTNGGRWTMPGAQPDGGPDPIAQAMVAKYLARSTPEERSESSRQGALKRWAKVSKKQRSAHMRRMARAPRPGALIADRCPCGKYSKALAERRGHKCSPEGK